MLETLNGQDLAPLLDNIGPHEIVESITLKDVKRFLESLGVDQIIVNEEKGYLVCPTICHNSLAEAKTMKLYWYQNYKVFHCYTECNESMSIFTLYRKFMEINYYPVSEIEAENYVKQCLHDAVAAGPPTYSKFDLDVEKYRYTNNIPVLSEYPMQVLDCFSKYYTAEWLRDGITKEAMDKFKIEFSLGQNKIVIPHFDINGRLVGIRGRALNPREIEEFGKYRPIQVGQTLYTHQLQFNLYGIYEHQNGIRARRSAIIAESEKSVLLDEGYYGKLSNTVACCGSSFNKYHISMLTDILGANEIVVALDKEYEDWHDDKAKKYREKIERLCRKYIHQATFSYIWDYDNLLEEKDSPFDKGKEIFDELYKNRVRVK